MTEICTPETGDKDPWISNDGKTIYWASYPQGNANVYPKDKIGIFSAERPDPASPFGKPRMVKSGICRHPALPPDELEIVFLAREPGKREWPYFATRDSRQDVFGESRRYTELEEITPKSSLKSMFYSSDGDTLHIPAIYEHRIYSVTRPARDAPFGKPQDLVHVEALPPADVGTHSWPFISSDGRFLFCDHEFGQGRGELIAFKRESLDEPFQHWGYIEIPGVGILHGRSPRYCEVTGELYFAARRDLLGFPEYSERGADWELWVIKNFDPERIEFPGMSAM